MFQNIHLKSIRCTNQCKTSFRRIEEGLETLEQKLVLAFERMAFLRPVHRHPALNVRPFEAFYAPLTLPVFENKNWFITDHEIKLYYTFGIGQNKFALYSLPVTLSNG